MFEAPSGAGAKYALPPVAEANATAVPVILLTIEVPLAGEGRGVITEMDGKALFEPASKASIQIKAADKIPEILRRAFRIATTGKPGAVHLVVAEDILHQEVADADAMLHAEEECGRFPAHPTLADSDRLERLLDLIEAAERPLLIAGGGVMRAPARAELTAFAEALDLPVVTTITRQSAMADDHRLAIGVIGGNGHHPHSNAALERSDLLVYLGSRVGSVVSTGWTFPSPRPKRRIAQIDIDPQVLGDMTENALSIAGDVRLALQSLLARSEGRQPAATAWVDELNAMRAEF